MRILIYSLPRTGCSSLFKGLTSFLPEYHSTFEPFYDKNNHIFRPDHVLRHKNLLVKTCVEDIPLNWEDSLEKFGLYFISLFDRIIFIDRKNIEDHWESYVHLIYKLNYNIPTGIPYESNPQILKELETKINLKTEWDNFIYYKKILKNLSLKLNIPITYYEDIFNVPEFKFIKNTKNWGLDIDFKNLYNNKNLSPLKKLKNPLQKS